MDAFFNPLIKTQIERFEKVKSFNSGKNNQWCVGTTG